MCGCGGSPQVTARVRCAERPCAQAGGAVLAGVLVVRASTCGEGSLAPWVGAAEWRGDEGMKLLMLSWMRWGRAPASSRPAREMTALWCWGVDAGCCLGVGAAGGGGAVGWAATTLLLFGAHSPSLEEQRSGSIKKVGGHATRWRPRCTRGAAAS